MDDWEAECSGFWFGLEVLVCGSLGRRAGVQRQIAAAEAQPVGAVETLFDFRAGATQSGADILALHAPALAFPHHGVV